MKGNPDVVGDAAAFDWTVLDEALAGSASRQMHAVVRVILHFPGRDLNVPQYLLDAGIDIRWYDDGQSPYYGDPQLLVALEQFIVAFGKRYDGDTRLGFIQAGLLGFWGEWHTYGEDFLPDDACEKVVSWYASSFATTHIQMRYPRASAYAAGFGLHDDSFAYSTLDGAANGGEEESYFFWPRVVQYGHTNFWKKGAMGGETRPEVQHEVFDPTYRPRTPFKQNFMECVNVTHATYMFHHGAFKNGGFSGIELVNALHAHARMGYNFHVQSVAVRGSTTFTGFVDMDVTLKQIGVAPFYYDLSLALGCTGMTKNVHGGVDTLIDVGSSKVFVFKGIPASTTCLDAVTLSLESSYAYPERPVQFAQRDGSVSFRIPLPTQIGSPVSPLPAPKSAPVSLPIFLPFAPKAVPIAPKAAPIIPMTAPIAPMAAPIASVPSTGFKAMALTLIDANADVAIGPLFHGATVNLMDYPSINVRADPSSTFATKSVKFTYDGVPFKTDDTTPYAFLGRGGANYKPWRPRVGKHTIVATPYSDLNGGGLAGKSTFVSFSVVSFGVVDFMLINADTNKPIRALVNGAKLRLSTLPTKKLNVQAVTYPSTTGKVRFAYDGNKNYNTEDFPPYSLASDWGGDYFGWTPAVGWHSLTATAIDPSGKEGGSRTVTFNVVA